MRPRKLYHTPGIYYASLFNAKRCYWRSNVGWRRRSFDSVR